MYHRVVEFFEVLAVSDRCKLLEGKAEFYSTIVVAATDVCVTPL